MRGFFLNPFQLKVFMRVIYPELYINFFTVVSVKEFRSVGKIGDAALILLVSVWRKRWNRQFCPRELIWFWGGGRETVSTKNQSGFQFGPDGLTNGGQAEG